jgi:hypothetical protein
MRWSIGMPRIRVDSRGRCSWTLHTGQSVIRRSELPGATAPLTLVGSACTIVAMDQRIAFARSQDKTTIAYALSGEGPPLVRAGTWLTHVHHDW